MTAFLCGVAFVVIVGGGGGARWPVRKTLHYTGTPVHQLSAVVRWLVRG